MKYLFLAQARGFSYWLSLERQLTRVKYVAKRQRSSLSRTIRICGRLCHFASWEFVILRRATSSFCVKRNSLKAQKSFGKSTLTCKNRCDYLIYSSIPSGDVFAFYSRTHSDRHLFHFLSKSIDLSDETCACPPQNRHTFWSKLLPQVLLRGLGVCEVMWRGSIFRPAANLR